MTTTNQGRTRALREERVSEPARSGAHTPSSGDTGGMAAPGIAPRTTANTLMDDLGFDDVYRVHDGLGPDELDIEVEFEEPWHARPSAAAYLLAWGFAILAAVAVGYRLWELAAAGRLW